MVLASVAVKDITGAAGFTEFTRSWRFVPVAAQRSQEYATSVASSLRPFSGAWVGGVPASLRIFMVRVSLSGENSHDSAISPSIVPSVIWLTPGFTPRSLL